MSLTHHCPVHILPLWFSCPLCTLLCLQIFHPPSSHSPPRTSEPLQQLCYAALEHHKLALCRVSPIAQRAPSFLTSFIKDKVNILRVSHLTNKAQPACNSSRLSFQYCCVVFPGMQPWEGLFYNCFFFPCSPPIFSPASVLKVQLPCWKVRTSHDYDSMSYRRANTNT